MKKIFILLFLTIGYCRTEAQVTLENCYTKAYENYPLIRKYELLGQAKEYDLKNAGKKYLPQFLLSGQATYQSDVTKIPVSIPGITVPSLSKDQYRALLEISQTIWDGGETRSQKQIIESSAAIERQQTDVDMYGLRERVNNLFFGILLLEEQLNQNTLYRQELERTHLKIVNFIRNGVANRADLDVMEVELLNTQRKRIELETLNEAYRRMLSALIGESLDRAELSKPAVPDAGMIDPTIKRPELELFKARGSLLDSREKSIRTNTMPHFSAFIQGAYGNPGLNMLKNGFTPYAIGGIRFSWNFSGFYTRKNDMGKIRTDRQTIQTEKETFLFNTSMQVTSQHAEIEKYRKTMAADSEIIRLRVRIRESAEAKLSDGIISVTDYMDEITAEELARQEKTLHEMQYLLSIYNLKTLTNN